MTTQENPNQLSQIFEAYGNRPALLLHLLREDNQGARRILEFAWMNDGVSEELMYQLGSRLSELSKICLKKTPPGVTFAE